MLAVAEREEHRRDRAELHAEVAEEQRDVGDADSSNRIVRMCWARGGASISISFSAARMNGTSLAKLPSQSMRLTSVVTCG